MSIKKYDSYDSAIEFLRNLFDSDSVDEYAQNQNNAHWLGNLTSHKNNYKFTCIQTAEWAFLKHRDSESDYYEHVKKYMNNQKIDFKSFVCELVQNSIDHCTDSDKPIEIDVEINANKSLKYTHNGKSFGFENQYPTSTMKGLFKPGTKLKKYDFREGMFGIGFKSWIFFYHKFKLTSIKDGQKFEIEVKVDEHELPNLVFKLVDCRFADCEEEDLIEFYFSELHDNDADFDETDKIEATINSYTKKPVIFNYKHAEKKQYSFKMETKIKQKKFGKKDGFHITTLKNGKPTFSKYVINVDISKIKSSNINAPYAREGECTLEDYIRKAFENPQLKLKIDPSEWFLLPKISIYIGNENVKPIPLLSSLMPIDNNKNECSDLRGKKNLVFDAKFELESDRKNLKLGIERPTHFGLINSLIMKEMLVRFFEFVKDLDDKDTSLMFEDISFELFRFFEKNNMSHLVEEVKKYFQSIKNEFKKSMINVEGNKILDQTSEREPKQIPGGQESVEWCNREISNQLMSEHFSEVPAKDDKFILPESSLAIRELPKIELQEFVQKLRDCNLIEKFVLHKWETEAMQELQETLPLPGGYDCVILYDKKTGKKIDEVIEKLVAAKTNFKILKKDTDSDNYDLFSNYPPNKKEIFNANAEGQTVGRLFEFLLVNLGGKTINNEDWAVLAGTISHSESLVKANVSMWDEDEFGKVNNAIVHIPEFKTIANCRSIFWNGETGQKCTWIGMPDWDPTTTDIGKWWIPKRLPVKACESKYIICKEGDKPEWLGKEFCSLLLGSPINSEKICESFGKAILGVSDGFIKVDVESEFYEIPKSRWRSPLPNSMTVKTLADYKTGEYELIANVNQNGFVIKKAMPFIEKFHPTDPTIGNAATESIHDMHKKSESESEFNPFMNELVWHGANVGWEGPNTDDEKKKVKSSGFVVSILPWSNIFHQQFLDDHEDKISLYSKSLSTIKKDAWKKDGKKFSRIFRTFAARFGLKTKGGRGWSLTFSWVPTHLKTQYPNHPIAGYIPKEDDFWQKIGGVKGFISETKRVPLISGPQISKVGTDRNLIGIDMFTEFTLRSCDFNKGIETFLTNGELGEIKNWFNQIKAKLNDIVLNPDKVKLQRSRKKELEKHNNCKDWITFLSQFDSVSPDELKRELEDRLLDDETKLETIGKFSTKKDDRHFHRAFTAYEKGIIKEQKIDNESGTLVISDEFFNRYFRPHNLGSRSEYHGWAPEEKFRVIDTNFSKLLRIGQDDGLPSAKLLIHNSVNGNINHLSCDDDEYIEIPEHWSDSFDLFRDFINQHEPKEFEIKFRKVDSDEKSKLFNEKLAVGKGGWDIRLNSENETIYMLNSVGEKPSPLVALTLSYACEKFLKILTKKTDIMNSFYTFCENIEEQNNNVFTNRQAWTDKFTNTDFDSYVKKCDPKKIEELFVDIKGGLKEIWDTKGRPAPESIGEQLLSMRLRSKSIELSDSGKFTPTKMEKMFENWYGSDSMAADEIKFRDGLGTLNKNLFKFHPANRLEEGERRMKSRKIDTFMGSVIQINTFYGRLAENKNSLCLNRSEDGVTLRTRVVDAISNGLVSPDQKGLMQIPNALSVKDGPSTLRIHVLHAVAMAAVEELLNEIEEGK